MREYRSVFLFSCVRVLAYLQLLVLAVVLLADADELDLAEVFFALQALVAFAEVDFALVDLALVLL